MTANARLRSVVHVLTSFITTLLANIFGDLLGASHEVRRFLQFATVRKRYGCTDPGVSCCLITSASLWPQHVPCINLVQTGG
jgi:hypothetical protein